MWGSWRRALTAPAAVVTVLVAAWAAATGPVDVFTPSGRTRSYDAPTSTATPTEDASAGPTLAEATRDVEQRVDLSWLGDLVAWAILLAVLGVVGWGVTVAVRHRYRRGVAPLEVEFDALPEERAATALAGDAAGRLAALEEGTPRNGIVACWARLEQAVAEAGLLRRPEETSAEFTVRVLHALDLDPHAIGELAALYREARFSEHPLTESARQAAAGALRRLQDDLAAIGVGR